jgi:hypothetical protein
MRQLLHRATLIICIAFLILLAGRGLRDIRVTAQEDASAILLDLVNEARLDEGLDPYRQSRLLADAAQRHASDLAANGFDDPEDVHLGSDGTDEEDRIEDAGYAAWTQDEQLVVAEAVWSGRGSPEDVLASLLEDPAQRDSLFSDRYREVGIGFATNDDGRSIYVLDFGARPNVLPIFINDGAPATENREVAIRLTNERARPEGQGTGFMGEAIEIRISNEPAFEDLSWQSWAPLVSWVLPDAAGEHTVYVEFRDAAGRTAASADNIFLNRGTPTTPTVVPATSTPEPVVSPVPESTGESTSQTPDLSSGEVSSTPDSTPTAFSQVTGGTPFPTWTPLPSPEPTRAELASSSGSAAAPFGMGDYRRPLAIVGILQGTALFLGAYWLMRRGGSVRRH